MSGGRYTKKIPEKIYFIQYEGDDYDKKNWVQGPFVNPPKRVEPPHLKTFTLVQEGKKAEVKRETWEEFCKKRGIEELINKLDDEHLAAFIYFSSVYTHEQGGNWRRQIVRIKKLIQGIEKKSSENQQDKK